MASGIASDILTGWLYNLYINMASEGKMSGNCKDSAKCCGYTACEKYITVCYSVCNMGLKLAVA